MCRGLYLELETQLRNVAATHSGRSSQVAPRTSTPCNDNLFMSSFLTYITTGVMSDIAFFTSISAFRSLILHRVIITVIVSAPSLPYVRLLQAEMLLKKAMFDMTPVVMQAR